jgi:HEPN domain-containing protein
MEKAFKSVYAYYGINIPRSHGLLPLFEYVVTKIDLNEVSIDDILIISDYYETDRYPGPKYYFPSHEEIKTHIDIAKRIFNAIELHISK